MKFSFFHRATVVTLLLGFACLRPLAAQAPATPDATKGPMVPPPVLDNDEMIKLKTVRAQVLAANPDLKAEEQKLTSMHDAQANMLSVTPEQKNAAFAEWKAYQKKMRAAMLKIDPTLNPLFAKLDEARKHGGSAPFQQAPVNKKTD